MKPVEDLKTVEKSKVGVKPELIRELDDDTQGGGRNLQQENDSGEAWY
mgnify:CR=1 FL=1